MADMKATEDDAVVVELVLILVKSLADQATARTQIACAIRQLQQGRGSGTD